MKYYLVWREKVSFFRIWLAFGIVLVLTGCSSVPRSTEMIPEGFDLVTKHASSVSVNVEGGVEEDSPWISNQEIQKAVEESILQSKVFSTIVQGEKADYRLDIFLGDARLPLPPHAGLSLTTQMDIIWNLSEVDSGKTIWQEIVTTSYTATMGDSIFVVSRMRMASENAAKENIKKGVELLSQVRL